MISSGGSSNDESCSLDEAEFETVQCFLPTGMVLDVSVHPDDEIFHIKQYVISNATADGKIFCSDFFLSLKKNPCSFQNNFHYEAA